MNYKDDLDRVNPNANVRPNLPTAKVIMPLIKDGDMLGVRLMDNSGRTIDMPLQKMNAVVQRMQIIPLKCKIIAKLSKASNPGLIIGYTAQFEGINGNCSIKYKSFKEALFYNVIRTINAKVVIRGANEAAIYCDNDVPMKLMQ